MQHAPRSLAELPFERKEPLALLNLEPAADGSRRAAPEHDFAGFGWAELDALTLSSDDGEPRRIGPVLVLALHTADEPPPPTSEPALELAFELGGGDAPLVLLAPLPRFLAAWLPRLPAAAPHVVLALCNPQHLHLDLAGISSLGARSLHYAHGDVTSWLDLDLDGAPGPAQGLAQIRLHAHAWHRR